MKRKEASRLNMLLLLAAGACGATSHGLPWDSGDTRVIEADGSVVEYAAPRGDACLDIETGVCIRPQAECGERAADVLLDARGRLLETVCYPKDATLSVEQLDQQDGSIAQNQNNSVLALDAVDDGVDVIGDVSVDANNVVIYGTDPNNAVIAGDVSVDGNNIIVRGVRIQGDVSIVANDAVFLHCIIEGNVTIAGNNARLAACDVLGSVTIQGNNARVLGNHIVGGLKDAGKNSTCEENRSAQDADADGVLEATELGAPLSC